MAFYAFIACFGKPHRYPIVPTKIQKMLSKIIVELIFIKIEKIKNKKSVLYFCDVNIVMCANGILKSASMHYRNQVIKW